MSILDDEVVIVYICNLFTFTIVVMQVLTIVYYKPEINCKQFCITNYTLSLFINKQMLILPCFYI